LADLTLDLRGLQCPLPILRARKALRALAPGAALEVFATDPLSPVDFAAYCEASGDRLVESVESEGVFRFLIRRGDRLPPPPR
jgi:tRNA 2-thiouridine synthesizing protein A